jgi:hypothetical protein
MTEHEWHTIRTVVAFRLIGLMPTFIAAQVGISERAVQHILLNHGNVARRGRGYWWRGPYSVSPETHARLQLPAYIPLSVEAASCTIRQQMGWMALTRDAPVLRMEDGRRMLYSGEHEPAEPFYPDQGFRGQPPSD